MGLFDFLKWGKRHLASEYRIVSYIGHIEHQSPMTTSLLVLANDAKLGHCKRCSSSTAFLLPQYAKDRISLIDIIGLPFRPNEEDFTKEKVNFSGLAKGSCLSSKLVVWRHRSVPAQNGLYKLTEWW